LIYAPERSRRMSQGYYLSGLLHNTILFKRAD
jgi:hypothetical protein